QPKPQRHLTGRLAGVSKISRWRATASNLMGDQHFVPEYVPDGNTFADVGGNFHFQSSFGHSEVMRDEKNGVYMSAKIWQFWIGHSTAYTRVLLPLISYNLPESSDISKGVIYLNAMLNVENSWRAITNSVSLARASRSIELDSLRKLRWNTVWMEGSIMVEPGATSKRKGSFDLISLNY
ncbi:hypothetical protein BYT27DRAFT_7210721, partial [Phlegmacium glaucopus]